jgi:hypothetical protein
MRVKKLAKALVARLRVQKRRPFASLALPGKLRAGSQYFTERYHRRTNRPNCVFRAKSAADSGMKSAPDSGLISAIPI